MKPKQGLEAYLLAVVRGEQTGVKARLILIGLSGLEIIYYGLLKLQQILIRKRRLPKPVISIGNITAGGTGKTPTVVWLARHLLAAGIRPAVLTRGYGGQLQKEGRVFTSGDLSRLTSAETGDEPYLLAKLLPSISVAVGRDRYQMGVRALEYDPAIDLFLLDDGFQYWGLKRDLDIVLLDAVQPFDNRRLLPRGLLREQVTALGRAQLIFVTRANQAEGPVLERTLREVRRWSRNASVTLVSGVNTDMIPLESWGTYDPEVYAAAEFLKGRRVGLVTAVGNPVQVQNALRALGADLVRVEAYPDHHVWAAQEVTELIARMQSEAVRDLVITAKDAVKLLPYLELFRDQRVGCHILSLDFVVDDPAVLAKIMDAVRRKGGVS